MSVVRSVNRNRAELLKSGTAVTIAEIAEATDRSPSTARRWVARRERDGVLVVVRSAGELLVPTVQLTAAFEADTQVADVVARLVEFGMGPWAVWDWMYAHNGWIERRPARAIADGDFAGVHRAVDGLLQ